MLTVERWREGGMGGGLVGKWGDECSVKGWGDGKKTPIQTFSNFFLKTLTGGTVTTEAGAIGTLTTTGASLISNLQILSQHVAFPGRCA